MSEMFSNERYNLIFDYLKNNRKATVDELAGFLYVSSATIRRDLKEMQKLGLIVRSHGGALLRETANEVSIFVRREKNAREKELAAQKAMPYVAGFQSVFIEQIIPFNEKGIHPREKFVEYRFFQVKIYGSGIISVQQDLVRTARNMERFQQLVEQFSLRWIQHIRLVQQNDAPGGGGRAPEGAFLMQKQCCGHAWSDGGV